MPWTAKDAIQHTKKATSPKLRTAWAKAANSALTACLDKGGDEGECEAQAIRTANSAIEQSTDDPDGTLLAEYYGLMGSALWTRATSFAALDAQAQTLDRIRALEERTDQLTELVRNIFWSEEISDPVAALRSLFAEYVALVDLTLSGEPTTMGEINEQAEPVNLIELSPDEITAIEAAQGMPSQPNPRRLPVLVEFAIIQPGPGNKRDRRYYTPDALARSAPVFEGADIYATNHIDSEKTERTKVGRIRNVKGLTEQGLTAQVIIYDPDQAEKTRNRADAQELDTLKCSIYATGQGYRGQVDGEDYFIIQEITQVGSVDLVSRAGAGGHALSLLEGEDIMPNKTAAAAAAVAQPTVEGEQEQQIVSIVEEEPSASPQEPIPEPVQEPSPEPAQEQQPGPVYLTTQEVQAILSEANIPEPAQRLILRGAYTSPDDVHAALADVTALRSGGQVFALGESDRSPQPQSDKQEVDRQKRFEAIMSEIDPSYAANYLA